MLKGRKVTFQVASGFLFYFSGGLFRALFAKSEDTEPPKIGVRKQIKLLCQQGHATNSGNGACVPKGIPRSLNSQDAEEMISVTPSVPNDTVADI